MNLGARDYLIQQNWLNAQGRLVHTLLCQPFRGLLAVGIAVFAKRGSGQRGQLQRDSDLVRRLFPLLSV